MCSKAPYTTRREAQAAARWLHRRGGRQQQPYHCQTCGAWHLTTMGRAAGRDSSKRKERKAL